MAREDLHFRLRIPEELKARIETEAQKNMRSMTAEIVDRLESSFHSEVDRDEQLATLHRYMEDMERERGTLVATLNNQERILQRLTEAHRTIAILAKSLGESFLTQGDRSDMLRILASALAEVDVDLSSDPSDPVDGITHPNWDDD